MILRSCSYRATAPSSLVPHLRNTLPALRQQDIRRPLAFQKVRHASTEPNRSSNSLLNFLAGSTLLALTGLGFVYFTDTRASVHQYLVPVIQQWLYKDAEDSHHAGVTFLKELWIAGLNPRERGDSDSDGVLSVEAFGQLLANPIGISAGLDKNAEIPDPLLSLGPGIVEIGGVTPNPQDGNPKPRVFRIPSQQAVINRYGLNSEGADFVAMRLRQRVREYAFNHGFGIDEDAERLVLDGEAGVPPGSLVPGRLLAVQIAKNKATPEHDLSAVIRDHVYCVQQLGKYADIIVVNVSSPNTPGLRSLQSQEPLTQILLHTVAAANLVDRKTKPVVMVKVSPDEDSDEQIQGICDAIWESGVQGVIIGNTTRRRPDPWPQGFMLSATETRTLLEQGGYSGPQLFPKTLSLVKRYRKTLDSGPSFDSTPADSPTPKPILTPLTISSDSSLTPPSSPDSVEGSVMEKIQAAKPQDESVTKPQDESVAKPHDEPVTKPQDEFVTKTQEASHEDSTKPIEKNESVASSSQPSASQELDTVTKVTKVATSVASSEPKVIFASGGITNGEQALEVLNAGASVAMIYTAMTYGGVGTVTRIKAEMREKIGQPKPE